MILQIICIYETYTEDLYKLINVYDNATMKITLLVFSLQKNHTKLLFSCFKNENPGFNILASINILLVVLNTMNSLLQRKITGLHLNITINYE